MSVVIPAHNPGEALKRSLMSVLVQEGPTLEVIVVNDGSVEDLAWVEAADPRVRLLHQPNRGVSVARNAGVAAAGAPLVAFLDQDDEWLPGKLAVQLSRLAEATEAPFCSSAFVWVWPDSEVIDGQAMTFEELASTGMVCLSSAVVRREAYLAVGGHDPLKSQCGDFELFLNLCRIFGDPVHDAGVWVRYYYHGGNASGDYARAFKERSFILRQQRLAALADGQGASVAACNIGLRRTRTLFGAQALDRLRSARRDGEHAAALRHARWLFTHSPQVVGTQLRAHVVG